MKKVVHFAPESVVHIRPESVVHFRPESVVHFPRNTHYINPFTDFGFKMLFGSEVNKGLRIAFLITLLPPEAGIFADLSFLPNERVGWSE